MNRIIEFFIGALLISVVGLHHAEQDEVDLVLKAGSSNRIAHYTEGDELVQLKGLHPGAQYILHISNLQRGQVLIQHSDIRSNHRDRTVPKTSGLPLTLRFTAPTESAWFRMHTAGERSLSFSLLHQESNKGTVRAAGIEIDGSFGAEQLIEDVLIGGGCFDVTNISPIGPDAGRAFFSNGAGALGFAEGVMFSTGQAPSFTGPNTSTSTSFNIGGGGDPDLTQISGGSTHDAVGIEFDFTPTVEQVTFRYAFASEEYCEYSNTQYNDAFGFFLSGPGIGGPFSNGSVNLATIPGSNEYVTINNVNYVDNSQYYVNNALPSSSGGGGGCVPGEAAAGGAVIDQIEYDGLTVPLEATVDVVPCETYHIKLVVSDVTDGIWDSGVFLEAGSFQAGGEAELEAYNTVTQENFSFENDCLNSQLVITRQGGDVPISEPLVLDLHISNESTATEGVDYEDLPDQITIPAYQNFVVLPINVIEDDILEGDETIILEFDFICSCDNPQTEFIIREMPDLEANVPDVLICQGQSAQLTSSVTGGFAYPDYNYLWSNGANGPGINVAPGDTATYTVTVTDFCDNTSTASATVNVIPAPVAEIAGEYILCNGIEEVQIPVNIQGVGPFTLSYSINGAIQPGQNVPGHQTYITVDEAGEVELVAILGANYCQGEVLGTAQVIDRKPEIAYSTTPVSCPGSEDGSILLDTAMIEGSFSLEWSVPVNDSIHPTGLTNDIYGITLTDAYGCTASDSIEITPPPDALNDSIAVVSPITCSSDSADIELFVENGTPPYTVSWSVPVTDSMAPKNLTEGIYNVTLTDDKGCFVVDSIILEGPTRPEITLNDKRNINCDTSEGLLEITLNGGNPPYQLQWSTGDTTQVLTVTEAGTYAVTVNDQYDCPRTDSFTISDLSTYPEFEVAASDTLSCTLDSILLHIVNQSFVKDSVSVQWFAIEGLIDSISGDSLSAGIASPGIYTLTVRDRTSGCIRTDTVEVAEDNRVPDPSPRSSNSISCKDTTALITLEGTADPGQDDIAWFSEDMNLLATGVFQLEVAQPGWYFVEATDRSSGCSRLDSVYINSNFDRPMAEAGPTDSIDCETTELTLNGGASSGTNLVYQWSANGGGTISGDPYAIMTRVSSDGLYILKVMDTLSGCSDRDTVEIINDAERPEVQIAPPEPLTCDRSEVTLDASASSNGDTLLFEWSSPNGNIQSGKFSTQPIVTESGTYILELTNPVNSCIVYDSVLVELDTTPPPLDLFRPDTLTCITETVQLSIEGNPQDEFRYNWYSPDGQIISDSDAPEITVGRQGTYFIEVLNTENGCMSTDAVKVAENTSSPSVDAGTDQLFPCDLSAILLEGNGSGGENLSYFWSSPDGNIISGQQNASVEVDATGSYILEITNGRNGCTGKDTVEVFRDVPTDADMIIRPLTCTGQGYVEVTNVIGGTPPYEYAIDNGPFKSDPSFKALTSGEYLMTVRDNYGCAIELPFTITEEEGPILQVHPYYEIGIGESVLLGFSTDIPDSSITSIQWSPSQFLSCTGCPNPTARPTEHIIYTLTVTDQYGCSVSETIEIRVDQRPNVYVPNAFTPNDDGINDYFNIYGNEAVSEVLRMEIFNRWGDKVFQRTHTPANDPESGWDGRFRGQKLDPGVYVYVIEIELINGERFQFQGDVSLIY